MFFHTIFPDPFMQILISIAFVGLKLRTTAVKCPVDCYFFEKYCVNPPLSELAVPFVFPVHGKDFLAYFLEGDELLTLLPYLLLKKRHLKTR